MADRVIGDSAEDVSKVELRVHAVELGRADHGVHGSGTFPAAVRSSKQEILPTKSDGAERPFGGAIMCALTRCIFLPGANPGW